MKGRRGKYQTLSQICSGCYMTFPGVANGVKTMCIRETCANPDEPIIQNWNNHFTMHVQFSLYFKAPFKGRIFDETLFCFEAEKVGASGNKYKTMYILMHPENTDASL